jgi:hypothetical protein
MDNEWYASALEERSEDIGGIAHHGKSSPRIGSVLSIETRAAHNERRRNGKQPQAVFLRDLFCFRQGRACIEDRRVM